MFQNNNFSFPWRFSRTGGSRGKRSIGSDIGVAALMLCSFGLAGLAEAQESGSAPFEFSDLQVISDEVDKPTSVHVADIDADGDDDFLTASSNDSTVRLFQNMGVDADEHFVELVIGHNADGANSVRAADMDGDGDLDVIVASRLDDTVAWSEQLDLNSGSFGAFQEIESNLDGASFAVPGDLDGDGDHDIVATGYASDELVWYENLGEGIFSDAKLIDSTRAGPWTAHVTDLDGDGDLDLMAANFDADEVTSYLNDGTGMFDSGMTMADGLDGVSYLAEADVDQDGDSDVLFTSYRDDKFGWLENLGGGEFSAPQLHEFDGDGPSSIAVADIDHDGDADIAITSLRDDRVIVFENRSDGLGAPLEISLGELDGPRSVAAGDLDDDGNPDLLAGGSNNDTVGWFENLSSGINSPTAAPGNVTGSYGVESISMRWNPVPASENGGAPIIQYVATATPNGEGLTGHCTVHANANRCRILGLSPNVEYTATVRAENVAGAGPESTPPIIAVPVEPSGEPAELSDERTISGNSNGVTSVFPVDLDGDSDLDVLSASVGDSTIAWHENLGDDTYSGKRVLSDTVEKSYSVCAGDLDSDGDMDVLATTRSGHAVVWFANNGDGTFGDKEVLVADVQEAVFALAVDMDGDTDQDVVFASYSGDYIAWSENLGEEGFGDVHMISEEVDGIWSVHVADLNQDGYVDVISASIGDDTVAWHMNQAGQGDFTHHVLSSDSDSAADVHAGDLDNDGDLDILAASYRDDTVAWFENTGDNTFSDRKVITSTADGVAAIHIGDVDLDGDKDVFSASIRDDTIAWYENKEDGFSEANVLSKHADGARAVFVGDVEDDGDVDVFAGTFYGDTVSWWKNLSSLPPPGDIVDPGIGTPPATPPMNVRISAGAESLTVMWDPITPTDRQSIDTYVAQATGADGTTHTCRVLHPRNSCTLDDLQAEVEYSVIVWAENEHGASLASAPVIGVPFTQIYGISGTLFLESNFVLDGDTNDPNNAKEENDDIDNAQALDIPGNVSGWVSSIDDEDDYFEIELDGSPTAIVLYPGFYSEPGFELEVNLDLFLYDSSGSVVDFSASVPSIGIGNTEVILTDTEDGPYYVRVLATDVSSSVGMGYLLAIGPNIEAAAQIPMPEYALAKNVKSGQAIVKLEHSRNNQPVSDIAYKLTAGGYFKILAGVPDREFLAELNVADTIVANEVKMAGGEIVRFKDREIAEKYVTIAKIRELQLLDEVATALPNSRVEFRVTPNDPKYIEQWNYENINLPDAWEVTTGTDDVVVGFIDSGYIDHPDLIDRLLTRDDGSVAGYDMVIHPDIAADGDGIDPDPFDTWYVSHGTAVAGIIGAETDNGEHIAGVSWETQLMPIRVSDVYETIQGIRYAAGLENDSGEIPDPKPSVVNLSLGQRFNLYCRLISHNPVWDDLHAEAFKNETLLVWASGNENCANLYAASLHEYAINVGATNQSNERTVYSNYGEDMMLVAPGGELNPVVSIFSSPDTHDVIGAAGTSFAAPHVVGVMALMLGANDNLTVYDVYHLLRGTHPEYEEGPVTMDLLSPGKDLETGYGLIDAKKAVDAATAVTGGLGLIEEPRLRIPSKTMVFSSFQNHQELHFVNAGLGGPPLEVTGITSSGEWISGTVDSAGGLVLSVDRTKIPDSDRGGQRHAVVTVHSNGGSESLSTFVLVPNESETETGDIGTVYVAAIPEDESNPVLQAQLDTSAGEFTFGWDDIAYDRYMIVAYTNKTTVATAFQILPCGVLVTDGEVALSHGEMCGIYGDSVEAFDGSGAVWLELTGPATPAEMYMNFVGIRARPALLSANDWEAMAERMRNSEESAD